MIIAGLKPSLPQTNSTMEQNCTIEEIQQVIASQDGVIFACPATVCRAMYSGRGIIAPNTEFRSDLVDDRGYLPVEWWVMSKTQAKNSIPVQNEGVTSLLLSNGPVLLTSALEVAEQELMGQFSCSWPLTKVLDIGGAERTPNYTRNLDLEGVPEATPIPEAPPIPCHVHAGEVCGGRCVGHGKTEAYFFPPLDVPPYNLQLEGKVSTRLGLKSGTTKQQVLAGLKEFGKSDDLYSLLNKYEIKPWETWAIEEKIIHAPGPWPTFEIQLPQDDFHLLAWVLGTTVPQQELPALQDDYNLRGLPTQQKLLEDTLDWDMNSDPEFHEHWWRSCEVLHNGEWGRVHRLFYHIFYGEGLVLHPGMRYERDADDRPCAGIVWSGEGLVNGLELHCEKQLRKEFLVCPQHQVRYQNTSPDKDLLVFTVYPFKPY